MKKHKSKLQSLVDKHEAVITKKKNEVVVTVKGESVRFFVTTLTDRVYKMRAIYLLDYEGRLK